MTFWDIGALLAWGWVVAFFWHIGLEKLDKLVDLIYRHVGTISMVWLSVIAVS